MGCSVGAYVGSGVGSYVGASVGSGVGSIVGSGVGSRVGTGVGRGVGYRVGDPGASVEATCADVHGRHRPTHACSRACHVQREDVEWLLHHFG